MTQAELEQLERIRQQVMSALVEKYGEDKVKQVDGLGQDITWRMLEGEVVPGIEQWMYDVVNDFQSMILSHPNIKIPLH